MCTVARLGGEEFGLLTIGMEGIILGRFAESIRRGIAACDHSETVGERLVTASVGVDRKSTRRTPVTNAHLVCRLLLEKTKTQQHHRYKHQHYNTTSSQYAHSN